MDQSNVIEKTGDDAVIEQAAKGVIARSMGAELETPNIVASEASDTGNVVNVDQQANVNNDVRDGEVKAAAPTLEDRLAEMMQTNQHLHKKIDSVHGVYGNRFQQMQAKLDALTGTSRLEKTIAQLSVDDPAFEGLHEEFPELGAKIINGIRNILLRQEQQAPPEQTMPNSDTQNQQNQSEAIPQGNDDSPTQRRLALDHLQNKHPDFSAVAGFRKIELAKGVAKVEWKDPEFGKWIEGMPDDIRETILSGGAEENPTSQTILNILDVMNQYDDHRKSLAINNPAKTDEAPENEGNPVTQNTNLKTKPKPDLSRSLLPQGRTLQANAALTDEEIIENAKKAQMRRSMTGS